MKLNREGNFVSKTHRQCTGCSVIFSKTSSMTLCKPCNSNRVKSLTPEWKMHQRAKQRCKNNGRDFQLAVSDISIPDTCPILGIELNMNAGKSGAYRNSPSLDRINNNLGYVLGNIQVISQQANAMKGAATKEELIKFAHYIIKEYT